jgi:hypothetical protein
LFDEARQRSSVGRGVKFLQPLRAIFRQLYGSGRLFFAKLSFGRSKESGNDFILCKWFELIAF